MKVQINKAGLGFFTINLIFLVMTSEGCKNNSGSKGKDSTEVKMTTEDSVKAEMDKLLSECKDLKPFQFCNYGLDFIRLGDTLVWKTFTVPGAEIKDTVFEEKVGNSNPVETTDWNVTILKFNDGKVLLESDFEEDRYLNRIQIESPKYRNAKGMHVGMTFSELKKMENTILIYSFPEYNIVNVTTGSGLTLQFANHNYFNPKDKEQTEIPEEKIDKNEKVIRIVLM